MNALCHPQIKNYFERKKNRTIKIECANLTNNQMKINSNVLRDGFVRHYLILRDFGLMNFEELNNYILQN